jgi:hypothetical protein
MGCYIYLIDIPQFKNNMEMRNTSGLSLKKHDKFVHMALIVLDMITSCNMSHATIVYNEFKCFSMHKSDGKGNAMKEDCWLRAGFIFGEIISKVEGRFFSLIIYQSNFQKLCTGPCRQPG